MQLYGGGGGGEAGVQNFNIHLPVSSPWMWRRMNSYGLTSVSLWLVRMNFHCALMPFSGFGDIQGEFKRPGPVIVMIMEPVAFVYLVE